MPEKLATFIVKKRRGIFAGALLVTLICGVLFFFVPINSNMTKYLSPSSQMRQGIDIMHEEFPETATESTIRVMADDLTAAQIDELYTLLDEIPYVSDVTYVKDDPSYNVDNHTLFVLTVPYDYKTAEELSVEAVLDEGIGGYTLTWHNDDTSPPGLALKVIIVAVLLVLAVLFLMCPSWVEPLLFLGVIGIAVVINLGTNIILGSIADITFQISAILQLALSMDYSIILMSRFRQELAAGAPDSETAMIAGVRGAFTSVAASSLTTVVGLLMLCFMSYRIGADLGLVLAKGVFISMVCVILVLPGIILFCERWVNASAKPALRVGMDWAAKYSYRFRVPITFFLVLLFAGSYILQANTGIAYTLAEDDQVAEYFPADNTIVVIYNNEDEAAIPALVSRLEADENVKSVVGYSTALGKPLTAVQMHKALSEMGGDMQLSPELITMLYWAKFHGMSTEAMTAADFLTFLCTTVTTDETFASFVDGDAADEVAQLEKFADVEALTTPTDAAGLSEFFGLEQDDVERLLLLYFSNHPGAYPGTMTLPVFVSFVLNDVATDPDYAGMFNGSTLAQLRQLAVFTNAASVTKPRTADDAASVLGMSTEVMGMVYAYIFAQDPAFDPGSVTLGQVTDFIRNDLLSDGVLGMALDAEQLAAAKALIAAVEVPDLEEQHSAADMAQVLQLEASQVQAVYEQVYGDAWADATMSVNEFMDAGLDMGLEEAFADTPLAGLVDEETRQRINEVRDSLRDASENTSFTAEDITSTIGLDAQTAKLMVALIGADAASATRTLPLSELVAFLATDTQVSSLMTAEQQSQLQMLNTVITDSLANTPYTYDKLANLLGMNATQARQLYLYRALQLGQTSSWKLSPQRFLTFLADEVLENPTYAAQFEEEQAQALQGARNLVDAVVAGTLQTSEEMAELLSGLGEEAALLDENVVDLLYLYKQAQAGADPTWRMSIEELFTFLVNDIAPDPRFSAVLDDDTRQALLDGEEALIVGKGQLVTSNYARLIITTSLPQESEETGAFIADLFAYGDDNFSNPAYFIGSSVMNEEMKAVFSTEFLMISLLTALSIFLIVALTFRSLVVPLALVMLVQTGVNITTAIVGFMSGGMYYLALLIVECILMGSTIDYGILYVSSYREARQTGDILTSLKQAYRHAIGTILTSGLILVVVVGVLQFLFEEPSIRAIVQTLSLGGLSVVLLILFVLPGVLAALDRFVVKRPKGETAALTEAEVAENVEAGKSAGPLDGAVTPETAQ